jgi:hypothetical protein
VEETLEVDAALERELYKSGHVCRSCLDTILYADEVYLLQVGYAAIQPSGIEVCPIDGYNPHFFEFTCWEHVIEELRETVEDLPPLIDDYAVLECSCCSSGIREMEVMGLATYGELHCSKRSPEDQGTPTFSSLDDSPTVICISCLKRLSEDFRLWPHISQGNECAEGTHFRCWRYGCSEFCMVNAPNGKY